MPSQIIYGDPETYNVVSDWVQPQSSFIRLQFQNNETLTLPGDIPKRTLIQLYFVCDLLNERYKNAEKLQEELG